MSVLERVTFRTLPGTVEAEFLKAAEHTSTWAKAQPGFQYRTLVQDGDGWLDLVYWDSEANAKAAGEAFMGASENAALASMIDPDTVEMSHLMQKHAAMAS